MIENSLETKVNREKAFLTIVIALVFLVLIIAISVILFSPKITHLKQPLDTDINQALNLQKAITAYMIDTGDTALTFGEKDAVRPNFDIVVQKLYQTVRINNSEYGPYLVLPEGSSIQKQYCTVDKDKYKGFKITIYTRYNYKVEVIPHNSKNILIFSDAEIP